MATRRSALGRGLGALIPGASAPAPSTLGAPITEASSTGAGVSEIAVDHIEPNPDQPRRVFAEEQLRSLAQSIRLHGVLQPVVVRKATLSGRYELIVGERRWRAAKAAGLAAIPAVVAESQPSDLLELAIVENVQRQDLNPMELAFAYRTLSDRGATQDEIGEQVSVARSSVANHLRLLDLTRDMQEDVESSRLSMGHAKALLQISNPERRRHLRDQILQDALSVRETERRARLTTAVAPQRAKRVVHAGGSGSHQPLAETLQRHLQARVRIRGVASGRVEIEYSSAEDLQRIAGLVLEGSR